jgi:periplasmic protein TonB
MRGSSLGIVTSISVHGCIILLIVAASLAVPKMSAQVMEVDFALQRDQKIEYRKPEIKKETARKRPPLRVGEASRQRRTEQVRPFQDNQKTMIPMKQQVEPPSNPTIVTASDARGETVIHGVVASYGDTSGTNTTFVLHGGSAEGASGPDIKGGWGKRHEGNLGNGADTGEGLVEGSRDYNYIRDAIIRNIRYPDEALRLGLEGKVLVSFMVLENGKTAGIKVVSGSGYRLLDESAKEAVATTRIARKVPYRVVVHLPIAYKLQG